MVLLSVAASLAHFEELRPRVIYGPDNRKNYYEVTDASLRRIADSTPALFHFDSLHPSSNSVDGRLLFDKRPYGSVKKLCADQPYLNEPVAAFCSGALVAPDVVLTAGHCVTSLKECENTAIVFDYRRDTTSEMPEGVFEHNLYRCKELLFRKYFVDGVDYALLRLDREVLGREPLHLRESSSQSLDASLVVFGYPTGLPLKIADGATVRSVKTGTFETDADTFAGNSGSPVVNSKTLEIEGVLVRGDSDFEYETQKKCYVERRCAQTGCRGESATDASFVHARLSEQDSGAAIEEGTAFAGAFDGNGRADVVLRVSQRWANEELFVELSAYSKELGRFERVKRIPIKNAVTDQPTRLNFSFTLSDTEALKWGSCRARLELKSGDKILDSEFMLIQGMQK